MFHAIVISFLLMLFSSCNSAEANNVYLPNNGEQGGVPADPYAEVV